MSVSVSVSVSMSVSVSVSVSARVSVSVNVSVVDTGVCVLREILRLVLKWRTFRGGGRLVCQPAIDTENPRKQNSQREIERKEREKGREPRFTNQRHFLQQFQKQESLCERGRERGWRSCVTSNNCGETPRTKTAIDSKA